ncbi:acetylornithine transaminase [Centipeda periodontii DSM 2778]|uniref:Acetylornithine aminotransferase n=1 Tax=Centipeda periodontii DSM 2778 TaxID=888060 RepID=F5RMF3_9FIRM|nr:acetylornithine transaminase [Centipeda periodontii]EGK59844.1 acetylornithine transaminase [Centipeda periodontii DSM 2778]
MKKESEIITRDQESYLPVFSRYPIVLDHGDGSYVWDVNGRKYLDALGGIAVNVLGHNYAPLVNAIGDQAKRLIHVSNLYYTEPQADAAAKLSGLTAGGKVFFGNSGAEANEGAIKAARKYAHTIRPNKSQIITALGSFHGRTIATLTATGQEKFHRGFEPLPQGFDYVPFNDIAALETQMNENTAAVMLEPIQGEGGVRTPADGYLQQVRELCDKYDALLIFDEIQTGMGRTGSFYAYKMYGVTPDIVTLAKGLAGGVPTGAFIVTEKIAAAFHAGDHGSTFGGNPLACAAANVVLNTIANDDFLAGVRDVGAHFKQALTNLQKKYPAHIVEVRGTGLILGMEMKESEDAAAIVRRMLEQGVIINCTAGNVLRFIPPLIFSKNEVDELIAVLDHCVLDICGKGGL